MSTFKIEVLVLDGEDGIPEDKIVEHAANAPDNFGDYTEVDGTVIFVIGDERVEVQDRLSYILPTLALDTLPELVSDGESALILYSSPENFSLKSDGTTVTMTGNYLTEPLEFQQNDLIVAAMDACKRLFGWAEKVWPDEDIAHTRTMLGEVEEELASNT